MTMQFNEVELKKIVASYICCAFWSSSDENGEPLDSNYDELSLTAEAFAQMTAEARQFAQVNAELLRQSGLNVEQIGHDFWLTRNGHGAGFWDRDLPDGVGESLSALATAAGSRDLLVCDDERVEVFPVRVYHIHEIV